MDDTIASHNKPRRPCLPFPSEIRNTIYRLVLIDTSPNAWAGTLVQPALTRASKLTRDEALPIYYGGNQFKLCIPADKRQICEDKWCRMIKMFRVFATGGTGGPGTSWLRFIRSIEVVCQALAFEHHERSSFVAEPFALGFNCGRRGLWSCVKGYDHGCGDIDGCDDGRLERLLPFPFQRPIDDHSKAENVDQTTEGNLDLKDKEAIRSALQDAVDETSVNGTSLFGDMDCLLKALPVGRVVNALHMIIQECPEVSRRVELFVSVPCSSEEHMHHLVDSSDLYDNYRGFVLTTGGNQIIGASARE